jgi:tetratricopeptide (TPR) repeat protein
MREKQLGLDHLDVADNLNDLAVVYNNMAQYAQALSSLERALAIYEKQKGPETREVSMSLTNIGNSYQKQGEYDRAEQSYKRALAIDEKLYGAEHYEIAMNLLNMGMLHFSQQDYETAKSFFERTQAMYEKLLGAKLETLTPDQLVSAQDMIAVQNWMQTLANLAILFLRQENYDESITYGERALDAREKILGWQHRDAVIMRDALLEIYQQKGDYNKPLLLLERWMSMMTQEYGVTHAKTQELRAKWQQWKDAAPKS